MTANNYNNKQYLICAFFLYYNYSRTRGDGGDGHVLVAAPIHPGPIKIDVYPFTPARRVSYYNIAS